MKRKKLKLVPDKVQAQISGLCADEEARALHLADVALGNPPESKAIRFPGSRTDEEHRGLIEEVQKEAEKAPRRGAA